MFHIDSGSYISAFFMVVITSITSYMLIIFQLRKNHYSIQSVHYFFIYFLLGIVGWSALWLKESQILAISIQLLLSNYILINLVLLLAIIESEKRTQIVQSLIITHVLILIGTLFTTQHAHYVVYMTLYTLFLSPLILYFAFQSARQRHNLGNAIIGIAAVPVFILALVQCYGIADNWPPSYSYGLQMTGSSISFILVGIGFMTSMLINEHQQLASLSYKDPLTGLNNRRGLEQALSLTLTALSRDNGCISAIVLDADNFKQVNDTYGHDGGDFVLEEIARILDQQARSSDAKCRLGGEEFLIILPSTPLKEAITLGERIRQAIEETHIRYDDHTFHITTSVGIASQSGKIDLHQLMKSADKALYRAKQEGKNRVCTAH